MEKTKKDKKKSFKILGLVIVAVCLFVVGFVSGRVFQSNNSSLSGLFSGKSSSVDMTLYWQVWNLIESKYVDSSKVDEQQMVYDSIKGMVNSFGDAATVFLDPEETDAFNKASEGKSFEGIGAELGYKDKQVIVVTPLEGSPAKAAGIKAGDYILAVDGTEITDQSIYDVVTMIRGEAGTQVTLKVLHLGADDPVEITITRSEITVPSMSVEYVGKDNSIALFKVNRFTDSSYSEWISNWDSNVEKIVNSGVKKIILDLRGDPGGYLDAAIYAADDFLDEGYTIVQQQDSEGNIEKSSSTKGGQLVGMDVVVLVNSGTASAAEILSGALQQAGKAVVIGDKTYGKGTAQSVIDLSDGSSLHVTILKWLLPNGDWLNNDNPITPDIEVSISDADFLAGTDTQLNRAIKELSK